ncbi:hypothetical protein Nepgr_012903 [Nepenthes gracilis]|uniref:Uncharacterized protein n=1 Tax=Nepenthes gracilis TaxID=150966 RepID=A0AAD3SGY6_NEPGR|nr:hypothetical protein Nepgr_012903 [Nepenthes gracilis]
MGSSDGLLIPWISWEPTIQMPWWRLRQDRNTNPTIPITRYFGTTNSRLRNSRKQHLHRHAADSWNGLIAAGEAVQAEVHSVASAADADRIVMLEESDLLDFGPVGKPSVEHRIGSQQADKAPQGIRSDFAGRVRWDEGPPEEAGQEPAADYACLMNCPFLGSELGLALLSCCDWLAAVEVSFRES